MTKTEFKELQNLKEFDQFCKDKGQTLSKPKANRLAELLMKQLDAQNLDGYERHTT